MDRDRVTDRDLALPFQLFEVNHDTREACVALRADLAEEVAFILAKHSDGQNPCIFKLARHIYDAVDVLKGLKRIESCREFRDVEVVGSPIQRQRRMETAAAE